MYIIVSNCIQFVMSVGQRKKSDSRWDSNPWQTHTLVGCSNHWATEYPSCGERSYTRFICDTCAAYCYRISNVYYFCFQWHLNTGGHQLPLRHILPSTVAKLTEEAFDGITTVPVSSILIRLLPHSEVSFHIFYRSHFELDSVKLLYYKQCQSVMCRPHET